jgi:hypothetical protein
MDIPAASRARQQLVVCDAGTRQKSGKFQSWPCCLLTLLQFISFNYPNPKKKHPNKSGKKTAEEFGFFSAETLRSHETIGINNLR